MQILRLLYGLPESGVFWFRTYQNHHKENLSMKTSTYDPCLLISKEKEYFGIVGIQTDDTLILGNESFKRREQEELEKADFLSKPIENLTIETPLIFNGSKLTLKDNSIFMTT